MHIEPEPTSKESHVIIREPDTTTAVGSSPKPSPEQNLGSHTGTDQGNAKEKSKCERTLSQSSADDGEYTAQYLGTLKVDTEQNLLSQLAANLADLQQASYMIVNEGDIENSNEVSNLIDTSSEQIEKEQKQDSTVSNIERLNVDQFCKVKLERLDPETVQTLRDGSPVFVKEEPDTSSIAVKTEPPKYAQSSPTARKKRKTKKQRDRSSSKVL